ncbi:MAG: hypothetical protein GTO18_09370 [Anaerolineales bacterium]|nr:hypothetical protein [Anaerolineales bacterium]
MKKISIIVVLGLILSACSSSLTATETAVQATQIKTETPLPAATITPTASVVPTQEKPLRILFIGSSHIYYSGTSYDLPKTFSWLAQSGGHVVEVARSAESGLWLKDHLDNQKTMNYLQNEEWDYVVLQEDMYMGARASDREEFMYPAIRALVEEIKKSGAETILFNTWVNPNPIYDGRMEDYFADQVLLTEGYLEIAQELNLLVAPVDAAIENSLKQEPELYFWAPGDEHGHASPFGAYLTACVFYALLFQESPEGLSFVYQPAETSLYLQSVAADTILNK